VPETAGPAPGQTPGAGPAPLFAALALPPAERFSFPSQSAFRDRDMYLRCRQAAADAYEREIAYRDAYNADLALLVRLLTDGQATQLRDRGHFDVTSSTGRRWRIHASGVTGNVELLSPDGQTPAGRYCAHPYGTTPPATWLTQARILAIDEATFTAVANPMGYLGTTYDLLPAAFMEIIAAGSRIVHQPGHGGHMPG
jgi:hypothetical protein